jgi:hypothetical protein
MGTVTIVNCTNCIINSSISVGSNWNWVNKMSPKKYCSMEGGPASTVTVNVRYWFGVETEFSRDVAGIFLGIASIVIGVIGVALVPFTGGTSLAAAGAAIGGIVATGGAVVSIVAFNLDSIKAALSPASKTNVHTWNNSYFIAKGSAKFVETKDQSGRTIVDVQDVKNIDLEEITEEKFNQLKKDGYTEHGWELMTGSLATVNDLKALMNPEATFANLDRPLDVFNKRLLIIPQVDDDPNGARWEIENDETRVGAPLQLWGRYNEPKVEWQIQPAVDNDGSCKEFYIYNPALQRSVGFEDSKINSHITSETADAQRFNILITEDLRKNRTQPSTCFAFIPVVAPDKVIVAEDGNYGNSTKLLLGAMYTDHPLWGAWRLTNP